MEADMKAQEFWRERLLAQDEWQRWRELCVRLEEVGAVTTADLNSAVGVSETPGQRLFDAIRQWGEALVALRASSR